MRKVPQEIDQCQDPCCRDFLSYIHHSMSWKHLRRATIMNHMKVSRLVFYFIAAVSLLYVLHTLKYDSLYQEGVPNIIQQDCQERHESRTFLLKRRCEVQPEQDVLYRSHKPYYKMRKLKVWLKESRALVLEKEKAIFCFIPKVACSSWKTKILENRDILGADDFTGRDLLRQDEAIQNVLNDYGIKMLSDYKPAAAYNLLKTYYKFMFVRDPYERLLSAYRDKMADPNNDVYRPNQKRLVHHFKSDQSVPTFSQFLESIVRNPPRSYDVHWRPYEHMCSPCYVNYDFIGKMETLTSDAACVLSRLNMSAWFPTPKSARSTVSLVSKEYSKVDPAIRDSIDAIFGNDALAFGYKLLSERPEVNS